MADWHPSQDYSPGALKKNGELKKNARPNLLSAAYRQILGNACDEELKLELGLEDGATWAEVIGKQVVRRAVGKVPDDRICFRAITELRETTEGKTPEKVIAAGTNEELAALAKIMQGEPAPPDSDLTEDDQPTESSEAAFHADDLHEE